VLQLKPKDKLRWVQRCSWENEEAVFEHEVLCDFNLRSTSENSWVPVIQRLYLRVSYSCMSKNINFHWEEVLSGKAIGIFQSIAFLGPVITYNSLSRDELQRTSSEDAILKICLRNYSSLTPCADGIWSISYVKYMGYWVWLSISFFLGVFLLFQNRLWDVEFWHTCVDTAMHSFVGVKGKPLQCVAHNIVLYHINFFVQRSYKLFLLLWLWHRLSVILLGYSEYSM